MGVVVDRLHDVRRRPNGRLVRLRRHRLGPGDQRLVGEGRGRAEGQPLLLGGGGAGRSRQPGQQRGRSGGAEQGAAMEPGHASSLADVSRAEAHLNLRLASGTSRL